MRRSNASGATGDGRFKETPAPATKVTAADLNMIWDELCNVVENPAGGDMPLNPGDNGQLLKAIAMMIGRAVVVDAETLVLGNWMIKTGSWRLGVVSEASIPINYATPFPAGTTITLHLTPSIYGDSNYRDLWCQIRDDGNTTAGFICKFQSDEGNDMGASGFDWFAVGRTP